MHRSFGTRSACLNDDKGLSPRSGQHQGDVIGLFGGADPVLDGGDHVVSNAVQRQVAVGLDGFNQALFAKFSKLIFWFGNSITEGHKDVAGLEVNGGLAILDVVEQADYCSTYIQAAGGTILSQDEWREMAGVGV